MQPLLELVEHHHNFGAGRRALVEATLVVRGVIVGRVVEVETVPEPSLRLVLVQALAKGGRDEQAVEMATELGCDTKTIDNALQRVKRKVLQHQRSRQVLL